MDLQIEAQKIFELIPDWIARLVDTGRPWLESYGLWAVAIGLLLETALFAGLIVPGYGILVAAGYFAAAGVFEEWQVLCVAAVAAVAGDQLSYYLGRLAGGYILRRHVKLASRLERALASEGPLLLLWYHYAQLLRSVLPCTAGWCRYPWPRWTLFDSAGVVLWVLIVMVIGYSAYGVLHSSGNIILLSINGTAMIATIFVSWRVYRNLAKYKADEEEAEPPRNAG